MQYLGLLDRKFGALLTFLVLSACHAVHWLVLDSYQNSC
jgi:hypothetical protein